MTEELYSFAAQEEEVAEQQAPIFPSEEELDAQEQHTPERKRDLTANIMLARAQVGEKPSLQDEDAEAGRIEAELDNEGEVAQRQKLAQSSALQSMNTLDAARFFFLNDVDSSPEDTAGMLEATDQLVGILQEGFTLEELASKQIQDKKVTDSVALQIGALADVATGPDVDVSRAELEIVHRAKTMRMDTFIAEVQKIVADQDIGDDVVDFLGSMNPAMMLWLSSQIADGKTDASFLRPGAVTEQVFASLMSPSTSFKDFDKEINRLFDTLKGSSSMWGEPNWTLVLENLIQFRDGITATSAALKTGFVWADAAAFTPSSWLLRGGKTIASKSVEAGVRGEVGERVAAEAMKESLGVPTAGKTMTAEERITHSLPDILDTRAYLNPNEVGASAAVARNIDKSNALIAKLMQSRTSGTLSAEQVDQAFDLGEASYRSSHPKYNIKDIKKLPYEPTIQDRTLKMEPWIGPRAGDGGYISEASALAAAKRMGIDTGKTTPEVPFFPESLQLGPAAHRPTPLANKPFFRETSLDRNGGLLDLLHLNAKTSASKVAASKQIFVASNKDLALGQGDNTGVMVQFRGDRLSGAAHKKAGVESGEFVADFVARGAIQEIRISKEALTGSKETTAIHRQVNSKEVKNFLERDFTKKVEADGSEVYTAKPEKVALSQGEDSGFVVKQDQAGQFYLTKQVVVNEDNVYDAIPTGSTDSTVMSSLKQYVSGAALTQTKRDLESAGFSVSTADKLQNAIFKPIFNRINKLSHNSAKKVDGKFIEAQENQKWHTELELRADGLNNKEVDVYYALVSLDRAALAMDNATVYKQLASSGHIEISTPGSGAPLKNNSARPIPVESLELKKNRIFDTTDNIHYKEGELTAEIMEDLSKNKGYVFYKLTDNAVDTEGLPYKYTMGKATDFNEKPLSIIQVNEKAGGARKYRAKHFSKQAVVGEYKDTGRKFMLNPLAHRAALTKAEIVTWNDQMNAARDAFNAFKKGEITKKEAINILSKSSVVEHVEKGETYLDTWARLLEDKAIQDAPFEYAFDKELPKLYRDTAGADVANFIDEDMAEGATQWFRTSGRLVGSKKGPHLKTPSGEDAPIISPMQATIDRFAHAMNTAAYDDFLVSSINGFKTKWAKHMDPVGSNTPTELFKYGKIRDDVSPGIRSAAEANREYIKRLLNMETAGGKVYKQGIREFGQYVEGKGFDKIAARTYDMMDSNPINALRGFAFDLKLGLFNVSQLALQMQTAFAVTVMDPVNGFKAWKSFVPMRHLLNNRSENLLDMYAKKWKWSHGMEPDEFKSMIRSLWESGKGDVGGGLAELDQFGHTAVANKYLRPFSRDGRLRTQGRELFFEGERVNRLVAWRMAWERAGKEGIDRSTQDGLLKMSRMTDMLTMNMTKAGTSYWQHGWLKVPTQFKSYQMRLWENVFSSKSGLTGKERAKLGLGQTFLYGTAGLPLADQLVDWVDESYSKATGEPLLEGTTRKAIYNGFLDTAAFLLTEEGVNVNMSDRYNVGASMVDAVVELFSGDKKSWLETMVGPTGSILWDTLDAAGKARVRVGLAAKADNGFVENVGKAAHDLSQVMSSMSNITKAITAWRYGEVMNRAGTRVFKDVNNVEALFQLMSVPIQEMEDAYKFGADLRYRKEDLKEIADLRTKLMIERARDYDDMDKFNRTTDMLGALMSNLDPQEIQEVRKLSNFGLESANKGFFKSMLEQREKKLGKTGASGASN